MRFVRRGLNQHYGKNILIWISFPCTGGSSWQRVNIAKGKPETIERVEAHWKLFRKLWENLEKIEKDIQSRGARIAIEWPRSCSYWNLGYVRDFCARNSLETTFFDGCAYGLVAQYGREAGTPIRKPWRVDTNMEALRGVLNRTCSCTKPHATCQGRETSATENYTDAIAEAVHYAFAAYAAGGQQQSLELRNQAAAIGGRGGDGGSERLSSIQPCMNSFAAGPSVLSDAQRIARNAKTSCASASKRGKRCRRRR